MARVEVPMPQMGESIAEGTVSKWIKQVGDAVERDEPILEISTDKVDAEIPSPSDGVLVEIVVQEGETVEVGTVVAFLDTDASDAQVTAEPPSGTAPEAEAPAPEAPATEVVATPVESSPAPETPPSPSSDAIGEESAEDRLQARSTPVVRRIAEEHGIELAQVPGTGHAGRVTKQDILSFIDDEEAKPVPDTPEPVAPTPTQAPAPPSLEAPSDLWTAFYSQVQHPEYPVRQADEVETMDKIRRLTAEHMVLAKRVAPHVHSFIEIDFTRIDRIRAANREKWEERGARVSYTAFVVWACARLLREFPQVNSTISGNTILYRGNVNVGMAVDLDPGLIVPVIHDADNLSLVGIGKKLVDLALRARDRKLNPEEIQGGTFSITNPGVFGTLVGMPIIPKGTSAILGTGAIEKRTVVLTDPDTGADSIAIRKRAMFSLGYDHRLVDGADAARFLARLKELMEAFPEDA